MFEYAFVEAHGRTARPYTFMASVAGQLGLIALSILLPLAFVDALPQGQWLVRLFAPLVPPGKPVTSEAPVPASAPKPSPRPAAGPAKLFEPVRYPPRPAMVLDPEAVAAAGPESGGRFGVPFGTGDPQGALAPVIADALKIPAPAPPPIHTESLAAPPASPPVPLLRVGGKVQAPAPLYNPLPEYPTLARQARVSGVVHLEAIIGTDGTVRSVQLIQGHALLVSAALAAVRKWRYTPPTLNGDPIEILLYVDVNFELNR